MQTERKIEAEEPKFDWENYAPYKWFVKEVGGEDKMIPKKDGLSWMLRIHHREYTDAMRIKPWMDRETHSVIKFVDTIFDFKKDGVKDYGTGDSRTNNAIPAGMFFTEISLAGGNKEEGYEKISRDLNIDLLTGSVVDKMIHAGVNNAANPINKKFIECSVERQQRGLIRKMIVMEVKQKLMGDELVSD